MLKWLILIAVAYVLYRIFMADRRKKAEQERKEQENLIATGEMIRDPVCGTYIDAESPISVREGDKIYRFCSYDCRDKFLAEKGKLPGKE